MEANTCRCMRVIVAGAPYRRFSQASARPPRTHHARCAPGSRRDPAARPRHSAHPSRRAHDARRLRSCGAASPRPRGCRHDGKPGRRRPARARPDGLPAAPPDHGVDDNEDDGGDAPHPRGHARIRLLTRARIGRSLQWEEHPLSPTQERCAGRCRGEVCVHRGRRRPGAGLHNATVIRPPFYTWRASGDACRAGLSVRRQVVISATWLRVAVQVRSCVLPAIVLASE